MTEYPVIGKLCSWPTVVGFLAGIVFVAFIVYPPQVGWGGGMKWGDVATWVGALTSGCAAFAAWYASRLAIRLARLPIEQQEAYRVAKARAIAAAILREVYSAEVVVRLSEPILLSCIASTEKARVSAVIRSRRISGTALIERFLEDFSAFGSEDGIKLMMAAERALNFNSAMEDHASNLDDGIVAALLYGDEYVAKIAKDASATCRATWLVMNEAIKVLHRHLGVSEERKGVFPPPLVAGSDTIDSAIAHGSIGGETPR